jgi:archaellum component FlaC
MEKDVDEVGKIARSIKSKLEELDKEVGQLLLFSNRFTAF